MSRRRTAATATENSPHLEVERLRTTPPAMTAPGQRTWLEQHAWQALRSLGSLQLAVFLLSFSIVVLAFGTILESWYSAKIAQELIYRTWWFTLLLVMLGVNIFCAAMKKWPWRLHQIGFLITHLGLLTMLAGGIWNAMDGTDAEMYLVDTDEVATRNEAAQAIGLDGLSNRGNEAFLRDQWILKVSRNQGPPQSYSFSPGSLPWGDSKFVASTPPLVKFLDVLANPFPKRFKQDLGDGANLAIEAYYPHARGELYSPTNDTGNGYPAFKVQLASPMAGNLPARWLALNPERVDDWFVSFRIGMMEYLGECPQAILSEFLSPPPTTDLGTKGVLAFRLGQESWRVPVAESLGKSIPLGKTGWVVDLVRYHHALRTVKEVAEPIDPSVEFTLTTPNGVKIAYQQHARGMIQCGPQSVDGDRRAALQATPPPLVWYHPPDYRFGADSVRGVLQFVQTDDKKLYYRSFSSRTGGFQFEKSGRVERLHEPIEVWSGMKWSFRVREHLPLATAKLRYVPEDVRPGLENDALEGVVNCRITVQKRDKSGQRREFAETFQLRQARLQNRSVRNVVVQGEIDGTPFEERFLLTLETRRVPLNFEVILQRAEQTVDPGTAKSATFTSFVLLDDPALGISKQPHVITMNQPLNHRGLKLYQSNFGFTRIWDRNEKPVSYSGFTVGHDPGLGLKYLGSSMLAIGIALMFYWRHEYYQRWNQYRARFAPASA